MYNKYKTNENFIDFNFDILVTRKDIKKLVFSEMECGMSCY